MEQRPFYDPFGERIAELATSADGDRRARRAALVVFWTAALLLTAGRVWVGHIGPGQPAVAQAAPAETTLASAAR